MNHHFWKNKRVFVTGHTGFKGSWLCLLLNSLGAKVFGYSLKTHTSPNLFELLNIEKQIEISNVGDVRDLAALKKAMMMTNPDIILHLAAQSLVRYSYEHPVETYETNVLGTVHILEAMRSSSTAKVFINVTSDKCYENKEWNRGYHEKDNMGGYDPYSSSKGCAELITAAYRSSYFNPKNFKQHGKAIATARAGNVIGGGDWASDRLIPDIMNALIRKEHPEIRFPFAIRPWQHVLEPLYGYLTLAEKMWESPELFSESWNFGPKDEDCQSVNWVVNKIYEIWEYTLGWQQTEKNEPHEANFLKLNIKKANKLLKWHPCWNLSEALQATVEWYQCWVKKQDILQLTLDQIAKYKDDVKIKTNYFNSNETWIQPQLAKSFVEI